MATELTVNVERVRDDCRKVFLDCRYRFGLPCHEVDGFGYFQHDPTYVTPCRLRDWPTVWVVALIEGDDDYTLRFHLHAGHESREDALAEARRLSRSLLHDQETRRHTLQRHASPTLLGVDAQGATIDAYAKFEDTVRRERVFFGPLSEAGFATFARGNGAAAARDGLLRLQQQLTTRLLCLVSRGLRALPADARRCVCSFAFTPRACPALLRAPSAPELQQMSFRVVYQAGRVPVRGKWVASVPLNATLNDICRLIQVRLWERCKGLRVGGQWYDDDALRTVVLLLSVPFYRSDYRPGIMPPYFYQAHRLQRFAEQFPKRKGRLHVEALAMDKETVLSNT